MRRGEAGAPGSCGGCQTTGVRRPAALRGASRVVDGINDSAERRHPDIGRDAGSASPGRTDINIEQAIHTRPATDDGSTGEEIQAEAQIGQAGQDRTGQGRTDRSSQPGRTGQDRQERIQEVRIGQPGRKEQDKTGQDTGQTGQESLNGQDSQNGHDRTVRQGSGGIRQTNRQTDRQPYRPTDSQAASQTIRQTD